MSYSELFFLFNHEQLVGVRFVIVGHHLVEVTAHYKQ